MKKKYKKESDRNRFDYIHQKTLKKNLKADEKLKQKIIKENKDVEKKLYDLLQKESDRESHSENERYNKNRDEFYDNLEKKSMKK